MRPITLVTKILCGVLKIRTRVKCLKLSLYTIILLTCLVLLYKLFQYFPRIFISISHLTELDYEYKTLRWPLDTDIRQCVKNLKLKKHSECSVVNSYDYSFISNCENVCQTRSNLILVYVVKSKLDHFGQRSAIRKSWGSKSRFSDVSIRTVFILGVEKKKSNLQKKIEEESNIHGDIVQANFVDTYWNNTVKTMLGMQWAVKHCNHSKFYCFSDDDMYLSTKNVLRFLKHPFNYPEYLEAAGAKINAKSKKLKVSDQTSPFFSQNLSHAFNFRLPDDVKLYAGNVQWHQTLSRDYRSKRYISLAEYPFHRLPPYMPAGCYVLSFNALIDLYLGSYFTKHFRVDDVYLGIVAKKMNLKLFHCDEIYYTTKPYHKLNYRYVISSHGYGNPNKLLKVWNEQKLAGNA